MHSQITPATEHEGISRTEFKRRRRLAGRARRVALTAAMAVLSVGAVAGPATATASAHSPYRFETLNNQHDVTFNQLLGINQSGVIAGYFGSGAQGHPNKGYLLFHPFGQGDYLNENFPGSVQTQVTGLNDRGVTVGFWSDQNNANQMNDNFGFYKLFGRFHNVNFPVSQNGTMNASPPVNQLLGVNDHNIAVGFYTDSQGNNHGYTYDVNHNSYTEITIPGATSATAAAINNSGDIAGFYTDANGNTHAFLRSQDDSVITLDAPGATMTQALGVNDEGEVVGVYTVGTGSSAQLHGFTWNDIQGFRTVDDPNGIGTTTINGVNDRGDLVGFYVDGAGNTDGMLATPRQ